MSNRGAGPWAGVKRVRAKGRDYYYWTRSEPRVRLPDPFAEPDAFMRKLAHLRRVAERTDRHRAGTFSDAARLYRKSPAFTDRAASTQETYGRYLDALEGIFGPAPLRDIRRSDIQRYVMDDYADRRGAANMMLAVAHNVFVWAQARDEGLPDPTSGIEAYESTPHEPWPDHVLEEALASPDDAFRRAVALHFYTGQRTGDVCRATWNAIAAGRISVVQQKTGKALSIPLLPDLAAELERAPRTGLTILTNRGGRPLRPGTFRDWCAELGARHGIRLVPHGLRKNAVNALLEADCSTAEVSSITGQSLAMVEHYAQQRNQARIASGAVLKWGAARKANGKTFAGSENGARERLK
ncbi:tyrosine-type recombinase/integrase [Sphingomonas changnyeongensis]|uniref:Tyrosine-type recombinase/integrase n=1 Tax=Sphingomonas changnyeongensis TaxID=2698679 RepID=A0A7Z2NW95_9SPHN|nr:site-specific integrase [Sphingomonas changnyeongensis]QHL90996.1 tyrosine-type recombinase/integrase [Sphingomonas changnyeongensis]